MGYYLQAVVATHPPLSKLIGVTDDAHIVPLAQHLSLLPMTDALFDAVTIAGAPRPSGFRKLADCSTDGPVAYIEAEYFGGAGSQNAQVWDGRHVALGPLP
ncbi:hypothetical protein BS329_19210 [Amycolatopsis coloradensis]|uniref:Uncharacterized protein n=1 Tax=Amycolatopsis coloradensis TaxID=76021 RepID=A0A1R0KRU2_9PSEU|nr:hypothetical protein [Amycolatopsis coloradensis]OLZ50555.1 hypothetical protein BS329_19210 [Amycolatopsis coloradensis]